MANVENINYENLTGSLTDQDKNILECVKKLMPGIALSVGPSCMVSLHSTETSDFPCIAVENGSVNDLRVGAPASNFVRDALIHESHQNGNDTIGAYYARTVFDHTIKCVINVIRNQENRIIGSLCIGIDVSVPLVDFIGNFMPVVDNDLANSISDATDRIGHVDEMVQHAITQAIAVANDRRGLSATERNRLVVQLLQKSGVFSIRSAVNIVAGELGVSRYTIYNYLKDPNLHEDI